MDLYQSLFAKKVDPEIAAGIEANKREALKRLPATGNEQGIRVAAAAERLGVSVSTVYRWIAKGKLTSAFKSASKAGGRKVLWISGVEVDRLAGVQVRFSDADLH